MLAAYCRSAFCCSVSTSSFATWLPKSKLELPEAVRTGAQADASASKSRTLARRETSSRTWSILLLVARRGWFHGRSRQVASSWARPPLGLAQLRRERRIRCRCQTQAHAGPAPPACSKLCSQAPAPQSSTSKETSRIGRTMAEADQGQARPVEPSLKQVAEKFNLTSR